MKGVILAGGLGSRLRPLTKVTNKHLLPVYDKPMIYYPLETLCKAGIKDIMIVTGGSSAGDFLRLLGNGSDFGLKDIAYTYQEGERGIADALRLCEHFAEGGRIVVAQVVYGRIAAITEKPASPSSPYAVTGVYMYDARVFDYVRELQPSARGELEITDVNNRYLASGELEFDVLPGWWTDAGQFESLFRAASL